MCVPVALSLDSPSPEHSAAIARNLASSLRAGDVVLLSGPVGAGKSHFARALIQARLAALGRMEDVPSPSFTLVQSYDLGDVELWHADLYRLHDPHDCLELGLEEAFEAAICLIEWPDRLGRFTPADALHLQLQPGAAGDDSRKLDFRATAPRWQAVLDSLRGQAAR
ncbi:MAG: tRNA (adenosine(37)-N6)-threonylcarbamoyltransferase complex ATPase subunit type 1 TsaE [Rhodobacteraceae bacterium]|nr:tRNA (adenosine(37)-N6)-threonylcarbamoyltransferase complex ATPase subunit type 1 TsaE [Paracoccaceae bacterium]